MSKPTPGPPSPGFTRVSNCQATRYLCSKVGWLGKTKPSLIVPFLAQNFAVDNGYMTADDLTETTVRVKNLSPRQLGVYTCRAQNKLGSAEKEYLVTEAYKANCIVGQCDDFSSATSTTKTRLTAALPLLVFLYNFFS